MVANIAVDGVGKIDHSGATRHRHDLTLGRKDINRIREQINFHMLPKLSCITVFVLDVQQRLQPLRAHSLSLPRILRALGLVEPMRGDASFGNHVHGLGAYLKLNVRSRRPNQGGVQRLVTVEFADGDMVLETPGKRFIELV